MLLYREGAGKASTMEKMSRQANIWNIEFWSFIYPFIFSRAWMNATCYLINERVSQEHWKSRIRLFSFLPKHKHRLEKDRLVGYSVGKEAPYTRYMSYTKTLGSYRDRGNRAATSGTSDCTIGYVTKQRYDDTTLQSFYGIHFVSFPTHSHHHSSLYLILLTFSSHRSTLSFYNRYTVY